MLNPEMTEDTHNRKLGVKDKVQVDLVINNRAAGTAPPTTQKLNKATKFLNTRLPFLKKLFFLTLFSCLV